MDTEYHYLSADEIKVGDILPGVSRFPVSAISRVDFTDTPGPMRLAFRGTEFTRDVKYYGIEYGYECFRVESSH